MILTSTNNLASVYGPFNAVGIRGERVKRQTEFGLYADGAVPVPECDIRGALFTSAPNARLSNDTPLSEISEPVLFAGLAPQQFGHVILNSIGRLWAVQHTPSDTALLFLPRNQARLAYYPYLKPILEMLGLKNRVLLHEQPMRYSTLYTAQDLFGERHGGTMKPQMRDWLAERLSPRDSITKGRKLYFTRSRLGPQVGRYCNEDLIEELLCADGYEVVAPEQQSLSDQVALMQDAEVLLFAESSALHLYGLVQRAHQRVGLIQRRRDLPPLIVNQLQGGPAEIRAIDAISEIYWPPRRQDNVSIAKLDFDRLRHRLIEERFLSKASRWRTPGTAEVTMSLNEGLMPGTQLIAEEMRLQWLRVQRRRASR
ncbi:glycosyltransferase 61 family protein [Yoonia sp.]|uniref:glycosyltransferase 61 family protein n=1 Tax=Yoonia sp. TaxID=2212373 RepID=UPI003975AD23